MAPLCGTKIAVLYWSRQDIFRKGNKITMAYYLKLYLATLVACFAVDIVWLTLVARTFYRKYLGFLMAPSPKWAAAIIFYLLFIVGILVLAVLPAVAILEERAQ